MIRAIFFDFNGVVIDDEALHMQAYLEVLKDEGVTFTEEEYYDSMGMDDKTFVRAIYERAGRRNSRMSHCLPSSSARPRSIAS